MVVRTVANRLGLETAPAGSSPALSARLKKGKKMKSIGIIGGGYVGTAMKKFFEKHYYVLVYDKNPERGGASKDDINSCSLGVISVPTPRGEDGSCDISAVEEVMGWLETPLILLKSTVEVGTTKALKAKHGKRLVFSPEYCGESSYWSPYSFDRDIKETPFFIFGGDKQDTSKMVDLFLPVTGPVKRYIQTDSDSAEMAKYMENSFYALKIAFCYEAAEICRAYGADWNTVRELWLADPRINPMHTAVFAENDRPFGGKCLVKDISAFASLAKKAGYKADLLNEVISTNEKLFQMRSGRNKQIV